jgi:hypothetical protein
MKNSILLLLLIFISAGFSFSQNQKKKIYLFPRDSAITYTLGEVNVTASKDNLSKDIIPDSTIRSFYAGDPQKELTFIPGVVSVAPFMAEETVDNLPSQYTGTYYGRDMLIPVLGNKTVFEGGASVVNPELFSLELESDSYPSVYGDIGGIKKMIPKDISRGFAGSFSSDLVDRNFTISGSGNVLNNSEIQSRFSLRQVRVLKPVTNLIPELNLLPEVIDFEGYVHFRKANTSLETYFLNSNQYQNIEKSDYFNVTENIRQDLRHNLLIGILRQKFHSDYIKLGIGYEYQGEASDLTLNSDFRKNNQFVTNLTMNLEFSNLNNSTRLGFASYSLRNLSLDGNTLRNIYRFYGEKTFPVGNFLLNFSASVSHYKGHWANSEALKISYFLEKNEFNFSVANYGTFLFDNSNSLAEISYKKEIENPDMGKQVSLGGNLKFESELFSSLDVSLFLKYINAEYLNEGYVKGESKGFRFLLKSKMLNSVLTGYLADSKINGHGITGTVDYDFVYTYSLKIFKDLSFDTQLYYRDGIWAKNQSTGIYSRFENAFFLNIGFSSNINIWGEESDINITCFNVAGKSPELIRYYVGDKLISKKAPTWGNISFSTRF